MKPLQLQKRHMEKLRDYGLQALPVQCCHCVLYSPGEAIVKESDLITRLWVVVQGRAKVCRNSPDGKSLILFWYISNGVIGEVELLTGREVATTTVTAISEFECIAIDLPYCQEELESNTVFSNKLGAGLAEKLCRSSDNWTASALHTGEQRLCAYILQSSYRGVFSDVLTDVACSIGVSYRHLLRILSQLCQSGILERQDNGFHILDVEKLEMIDKRGPDNGTEDR